MRILQIIKEVVSLALKAKVWDRRHFSSTQNAILLRQSLENLGSVFIKFGQMLALRPDFIPNVFCDELYKLLDQVPPFDSDQIKGILERELGHRSSQLLNLEMASIASASFAQVHKATLSSGEVVAVKIQRPNIDRLVRKDLRIIRFLAYTFDLSFRPLNKASKIVQEFEDWTKDELDYLIEVKNIERFNTVSGQVGDNIRGPKVYKDLSTTKVLTMEFIEGYSLNQIITLKKSTRKQLKELGFNGKEVIYQLIRNVLETAHVYGFFHADPHPANIIFTPNQELVFIDFGIVGELNTKERILMLRYLRSLLSGEATESLETLVELCHAQLTEEHTSLRQEYQLIIDRFIATFDAKTYLEQQIRSGPIFMDALNLLQRNGFETPISIVRYFKAFETIEGLIFALYPELQIKDMVKEFRRVSIINLVDSLPNSLTEKGMNTFLLKLIGSLEKSLLLDN